MVDRSSDSWVAPGGTRFARSSVAGGVRITALDGREVILPLEDLRSLLESGWLEESEEGLPSPEPGRPTVDRVRQALRRSRALVFEDPGAAEEQARRGLRLAEDLDPRRYGGAVVRDQQALAEACLANALRVTGDLERARRHMARARRRLALGVLGSLAGVTVRELEVSLCRDLREFEAALEISEGVIDDHRGAGRRSATARAWLTRASLWEVMGEPEEAIPCLREAAREAPPDDAELTFWTAHNLAFALARAGRKEEASRLFERWRPLYGESGKGGSGSPPAILARRDWLAGLLAEEPVTPLVAARRRFQNAGFAFDAALVSLDLAMALVAAGRSQAVLPLAEETYRELDARGVERDALMALLQVQQAVRESPEHLIEALRRAGGRLRRAFASSP